MNSINDELNGNVEKYGRWISYLYRHFQMFINRELIDINVASSEFVFLLILSQNKTELFQSEFTEYMKIDKAAVARSIKSLEVKGFVERSNSVEDQRNKVVKLTTKGQEVSWRIFQVINKWNTKLERDISKEDLEITARTLKKMAESI